MRLARIIFKIWRTAFSQYGRRLRRLVFLPFYSIRPNRGFLRRPFDAPFEWIFVLADLVFLPEWYSSLGCLIKWNTRPLNLDELSLMQSLKPSGVDLSPVHIDDRALIGPSWARFAYVSFYTVNYYDQISRNTLAHELVHLWQFQKFGSVYLYHALMSQWSSAGYNYGGYTSLLKSIAAQADMMDYNFEQQGDILADYYRTLQMSKRGVVGLEKRVRDYEVILSPMRD